jgi:hypothetical protein
VQEKGKAEEANITTDINIRNKCFYFDRDCNSHMTPYGGGLLDYTKCSRFVKSSSQESMAIVVKGYVILDCVLRDESVSSFLVCDVLHVPKLGNPIIFWRNLRTKGYSEFGEWYYISTNHGKKVIFEPVFDGKLYKIPEISHSAHIPYNICHHALRHLASSLIDQRVKLYSDANIPAKPKDNICGSCL